MKEVKVCVDRLNFLPLCLLICNFGYLGPRVEIIFSYLGQIIHHVLFGKQARESHKVVTDNFFLLCAQRKRNLSSLHHQPQNLLCT